MKSVHFVKAKTIFLTKLPGFEPTSVASFWSGLHSSSQATLSLSSDNIENISVDNLAVTLVTGPVPPPSDSSFIIHIQQIENALRGVSLIMC